MVESRGSGGGRAGWLLRQRGRLTGSAQWQRGRGRPQKPTGPRVEERLSCVGLPVCTCRSAAFPGRETHSDGLDHSLKISGERIKVVEQRGVDPLLERAEDVVDTMT